VLNATGSTSVLRISTVRVIANASRLADVRSVSTLLGSARVVDRSAE